MDVDLDPNDGNDECIYQVSDDRFYMVIWVNKSRLPETRKAVTALREGDEAVFGTISCGERVWIWRDESGYWICVGDTDSKDICYNLSKTEVDLLLKAEIV